MSIISDLRTAVSNALSGGATDAAGVRVDVETQAHRPPGAAYQQVDTASSGAVTTTLRSSCFLDSARDALPRWKDGEGRYSVGGAPHPNAPAEGSGPPDVHTDRVVVMDLGGGRIAFAGTVTVS